MTHFAKILLIIGGLNWGLIGLGIFINKNLNFIDLLSAFYPNLPAIIYCVVGLAAILLIFKKS
jgi:uncharacterized membrane protein YuzA (DUF378 family)